MEGKFRYDQWKKKFGTTCMTCGTSDDAGWLVYNLNGHGVARLFYDDDLSKNETMFFLCGDCTNKYHGKSWFDVFGAVIQAQNLAKITYIAQGIDISAPIR